MTEQKVEITTRTILTAILLVIGVIFLYLVRNIILIFLVAITLASALEPLVASAYRKLKWPRSLTVILVYVVVIGGLGFFFYKLTPPFVHQFQELGKQYEEFTNNVLSGDSGRFFNLVNVRDAVNDFFQNVAGSPQSAFAQTLNILNSLLGIIAILIISFYLVVQQGAIRDTIKEIIPQHHREKALSVVTAIQRKLGFWLLGQFILSLTIFLVTYIALSLLNIPLALALAGLAGILEILPFLGPIIAAIPAILVAFTISPTMAVIVALLYVGVQQAEGYILVPKVMEKTVGINPLMVLFAILIGFQLAGILGALIAVPIVAASTVLIQAYVFGENPKAPPAVDQLTL